MSVLLALMAQTVPLSDKPVILVTASRAPVAAEDSSASATILDQERIEALGEVQTVDLLRLAPGVSVSVSGARGTQAQIRIRGGEANHSLLFIDGIAFNNPASGNEARFEDLTADGLARIEVVRGPQSALWGSEAIGGVIALESPDPFGSSSFALSGEVGSFDSFRASAAGSFGDDEKGLTFTASHSESDGIDIVGGGLGDRDGYDNSTVALLAGLRPGSNGEIGLAARYIEASSEFDGFDPVTFLRADTLDNSQSETFAIRGWGALGRNSALPWAARVDAQYLLGDNRNFNDASPLNRTRGDRLRLSGQVERRLRVGPTTHRLIAAIEREDESFAARDQRFFGATNQDRSRGRTAYIGEWRANWGSSIATDVALRHDAFNRFTDATTFRAGIVGNLTEHLALTATYGEGIAQPSFFDLYGFFPGNFVGNPTLRPERSRSYEAGLEWRGERFAASLTAFSAELEDEIVGTFDAATFLSSTANATGESERRGIELSARWIPIAALRVDANYTYLDAEDQQVAGGVQLREVRRPESSANITVDYQRGPLTLGGALSYVGSRRDTDFDLFPAQTVTLSDYVLASMRIGYAITDTIEVFARGTNLFDEEYQDVVGYATPGRALYAGLRLRLGG